MHMLLDLSEEYKMSLFYVCCRIFNVNKMAEIQGDNSDNMQIIRGIPFPKSERFIEKNILDAIELMPEDGDVIIASYPKTGTTWLQYIILQILSKAKIFPSMDEASKIHVPFLELVGVAALDAAAKPRIYKHHIPYNLAKKNPKSKVIYIHRNPEDTIASYYYFRQSRVEDLSFDEFFDRFIAGNIEFGSYFDHVMSFYHHRDDPNLLIVSYEKLHANTKEEILRIAKFLGEEHIKYLSEDEETLKKIIENTSFESMKKNLDFNVSSRKISGSQEKGIQETGGVFFRKGVVGDGRNSLSEIQRKRIREIVEMKMKDSNIGKEWLQNITI